jgi:dTDP-4-dehydrorhamnose reductase
MRLRRLTKWRWTLKSTPLSNSSWEPLEIWGGVECTLNRVNDTYFSQCKRTGHFAREADIELFIELGFRYLRFPVLWERTAPYNLQEADWSWPDRNLARLKELGIKPIIGLMHHGSGPIHTNLVDPCFPDKFAEFAFAVAQRYSWVTDYIPINEPVSTARFSGLYAHWYPHTRDNRVFLRMIVNQTKATILAMRAIRTTVPGALLVQTDDLGNTISTPLLAYQALFEERRRWLGFDLLLGRVTPDHELWSFFLENGIEAAELEWFASNSCPPDVLGVNYYTTSERYLDERLELYPEQTHGSNGHHFYADVEAVRVPQGMAGPYRLLENLWNKYEIPIAITEIQNACTREEQMRWLMEIRNTALALRDNGVHLKAITIWSLLGSFDWHNLVTRHENRYEVGVFDVRGPEPRPTANARFIKTLLSDQEPSHPVLSVAGWWNRRVRVLFPNDYPYTEYEGAPLSRPPLHDPHPLVVIGDSNLLVDTWKDRCELRGLPVRFLSSTSAEMHSQLFFESYLAVQHAWAVIYAEYIDHGATSTPVESPVTNDAAIIKFVSTACLNKNIKFLYFSSDQVFSGTQNVPYTEHSVVDPSNGYGKAKAEAEEVIQSILPSALIVRHSRLFGSPNNNDFLSKLLCNVLAGGTIRISNNTIFSPTYTPDLVDTAIDLLIDDEHGVWHLANCGATDVYELIGRALRIGTLNGMALESMSWYAQPKTGTKTRILRSEKHSILSTLDDALARWLQGYRSANGNSVQTVLDLD